MLFYTLKGTLTCNFFASYLYILQSTQVSYFCEHWVKSSFLCLQDH